LTPLMRTFAIPFRINEQFGNRAVRHDVKRIEGLKNLFKPRGIGTNALRCFCTDPSKD